MHAFTIIKPEKPKLGVTKIPEITDSIEIQIEIKATMIVLLFLIKILKGICRDVKIEI